MILSQIKVKHLIKYLNIVLEQIKDDQSKGEHVQIHRRLSILNLSLTIKSIMNLSVKYKIVYNSKGKHANLWKRGF